MFKESIIFKKRIIIIGFTFFLILITLISANAYADMEKPIFFEGDYWEYYIELYNEELEPIINGESRIEIHGKYNVTIDNSEYEARIITDTSVLFGSYLNNTLNLSSITVKYYQESDISLMIYVKDSVIDGHSEIIYSYPFVGFYWPIKVGFSWERKAMMTFKNDSSSFSDEVAFYYECIGKSEVNTSIGIFSCYMIKIRSAGDDSQYTISYRSPEVGYFEVKSEEYKNDYLTKKMILKSFKYTSNSTNNGEGKNDGDYDDIIENDDTSKGGKTPGFEFMILLCPIIFLVLFIKRRLFL
jgi:hypothetical protein